MNMTTKKEIFKEHLKDWLSCQGDKKKRGEMARRIAIVAKVHLKSVSRSFKRAQLEEETGEEKRGRKTYYTNDVIVGLYDVWEAASRPCGELLFPMIAEYVAGFKQLNKWKHHPVATDKLLEMSEMTMKRLIGKLQEKYGINRAKSSTKPSELKHIIPIFKGPWNNLEPGNGQIDTVAHCGSSLIGDFAYTLSFVDAATYWGIRRAQFNKGQIATKDNLVFIKEHLPFPWLMAHPDSGSEFINWLAKGWCDENGINLTRSEPKRKNDNMYVEERNGHVVRKYLGWQRLDGGPGIAGPMNDYYFVLDLYLNHFQAVRRTLSKERIGSKYHRVFEKTAKTPYVRLMERNDISEAIKAIVQKEHESLNPLLLKEKLDMLKKKIYQFQKNGNQKQPN
jgi:hypothetical protein